MPDARQTALDSLIARIAQRDRRALDSLYDNTSARLNALCLSILKDRREAEEVLEQVYIRTWQEAPRLGESRLSPQAWLTTQARGLAMERLRALPHAVIARDGPQAGDAVWLVRMTYLEGLDYARLAAREGISADEARHRLHEGLERLAGHAADEGDSFAAAEQALGLRNGPAADEAELAAWQERLARFADDLTPVMAPARARQRIREQLGHGHAPLSVDPLERKPWWRGTGGLITAILLIAALGWYFWLR